ncbi:XrtA/PEP-CTERM system histidine kinase PrsK [Pseudoblastomonas halimionae]|uniref:histidine kinase n=1 Tax=Alteriqipengyuania halimionae TaxID=1926630 RepID=A0A6I4U278_9SPHN|nr:XrtA/PEP-CTERM system histidine kinase PrsK [Alteriqipengyuania halimionae]MXP09404.1 PEP-CTERM system histidine kinase PrsK [Alteriqipengyuania halimionae]
MIDLPQALTNFVYIIAAACSAAVAAWIYPRRDRYGRAGGPIVAALIISAIWAVVALTANEIYIAGRAAFSATHLAWLFATYRLFSIDGRDESLRPIRPMAIALCFVELLQLGLGTLAPGLAMAGGDARMVFSLLALFRLMVAVGALVLVHNLYVGASASARKLLRWPASALALMWVYDLNFFTIAYLTGDIPSSLAALRGIIPLMMAVMLIPGAALSGRALKLAPSRSVAFQSFSLLVIGAYLVAMVGIAQWLAYLGGDFARTLQLAFVVTASVIALIFLPSTKLRSWLKVTLTKHLFQHRYDYREEWLRFTRTIGRAAESDTPLHERAVHAISDITDSPGGLLLVPTDGGGLELAARWNWQTLDVPAMAMDPQQASFFSREGFVVDLDSMRSGMSQERERAFVPKWMVEAERAWALVPLVHYERLTGLVVLMRPQYARQLDWEDFDLLKVAGRQLASYLAEREGQEALVEARQFDEFNRRIAFVMHDIKNLASQLTLLARNAEKHAEKPEFRTDMLVTLRNSAEKLNALLARLGRYNAGEIAASAPVDLAVLLDQLRQRFAIQHPVELTIKEKVAVQADAHALEQVLAHLLQNAIDATEDETSVVMTLDRDGMYGRIEVRDSGAGMSAEFVRSSLFKPFVSSKKGGFGIGAFEARELVKAMRGRIEVESREGLGSRFTVQLPLVDISELYEQRERSRAGANE